MTGVRAFTEWALARTTATLRASRAEGFQRLEETPMPTALVYQPQRTFNPKDSYSPEVTVPMLPVAVAVRIATEILDRRAADQLQFERDESAYFRKQAAATYAALQKAGQ